MIALRHVVLYERARKSYAEGMNKTLQQVEEDVRKLSPTEQEQLREWLENLLEDRLELKEEFKAEIAAGKDEIAQGNVRVRKP